MVYTRLGLSPTPCLPHPVHVVTTDDDVPWGGGERGLPSVPPTAVRGVLYQCFIGGVREPGSVRWHALRVRGKHDDSPTRTGVRSTASGLNPGLRESYRLREMPVRGIP